MGCAMGFCLAVVLVVLFCWWLWFGCFVVIDGISI